MALSDLKEIFELHSLPETDEFNTLGVPGDINTTETLLSKWTAQQNVDPRMEYIFCLESLETNNFVGLAAINLVS